MITNKINTPSFSGNLIFKTHGKLSSEGIQRALIENNAIRKFLKSSKKDIRVHIYSREATETECKRGIDDELFKLKFEFGRNIEGKFSKIRSFFRKKFNFPIDSHVEYHSSYPNIYQDELVIRRGCTSEDNIEKLIERNGIKP